MAATFAVSQRDEYVTISGIAEGGDEDFAVRLGLGFERDQIPGFLAGTAPLVDDDGTVNGITTTLTNGGRTITYEVSSKEGWTPLTVTFRADRPWVKGLMGSLRSLADQGSA